MITQYQYGTNMMPNIIEADFPPKKKKVSSGNKNAMGRPLHEATPASRNFVKILMGSGYTQQQVANALEIDKKTLYKYYRTELENGSDQATGRVVGALFKSAMEGNVTAQIWITKARLGWTEKNELDVSVQEIPQSTVTLSPDPSGAYAISADQLDD